MNHLIKKYFSLLLLAIPSFAAPVIWDGSADISWYTGSAQAYNLTTAEQLAGLAKLVNSGTSFQGKTITLGADIFLNDTTGASAGTWSSLPHKEWIPIGTAARPFKGEFDGLAGRKNRKIYGLHINSSQNYQGLFGYTVGVKASNIDLLVGNVTGGDYTGSLIGFLDGGTISGVYSDVSVNGGNYTGGLLGKTSGTITKSYFEGNVTGKNFVGGLAGQSGSISGTASAQSYAKGNITGKKYVGGIVGQADSIVKNAYSEGVVKGDSSYVGGVAGLACDSLYSVYHVGGSVSGFNYVGGVAGKVNSSISDSYSEGAVTGSDSYVGGITGYSLGSLRSVYHINGTVSGTNYVGGVIGLSFYNHETMQKDSINTIYDSYAEADVVGKNYVGGLIGQDSLYKSFADKTADYPIWKRITKSYSKGSVLGDNYVGGIAGSINRGNRYNVIYSANMYMSIDSCDHSEGSVTGKGDYVGGVVGYMNSSINSPLRYVHHTEGDVSGRNFVGGLVGMSYYYHFTETKDVVNTVYDSYAEANVAGDKYVGGLVGIDSLYISLELNVYSYSIAKRIVKSYSKGSVDGSDYVGGIVGAMNFRSIFVKSSMDKYSANMNMSIESCGHSGGNVTGSGNYVGGIAGYARATLKSIHHVGGNVSGKNYVGGLAGMTYHDHVFFVKDSINTLYNSYAEADVTGEKFVGGLIGQDSLYKSIETSGYDYAITKRIAKSYSKGAVSGTSNVGGIVGRMASGYAYSSVYMNMSVDSCDHSEGSVTGKGGLVGGVIGYAGPTKINSVHHVGGDIFGNNNYVGGVVGYAESAVNRSYSEGIVRGSSYVGGVAGYSGESISDVHHVKGAVSGTSYVGGVVGSGRSISNSYSEGSVTGSLDYVGGVIGRVEGNALSIYHENGDVSGRGYVGGVIGYAGPAAKINSVHHVGGDIFGNNDYVGGVAGSAGSIISKSYSEGVVTGKANYVGGIAGYVHGNVGIVTGDDLGGVKESYHKNGNVSGMDYVGGLVGQSIIKVYGKSTNTTILNSYAEADVSGNNYIGGLIGQDSMYVINGGSFSVTDRISGSYSKGSIKGNKRVGGIAGYIGYRYSSSPSGIELSIDSCNHSEGAVTGTGSEIGGIAGYAQATLKSVHHVGGNVSGESNIGGIAGYANRIINAYSEGAVTGTGSEIGGITGSANKIDSAYHTAGNVIGKNQVGGIVGGNTDAVIKNSYFTGDSVIGIFEVGGLAGSAGSVDSSYSTSVVMGDDNAGGLVGSVYGNISNSYALGNVIGDEEHSSAGNDNVGGLVGYAYSGIISKSFALGNVEGTTKVGGLIGRFEGTSIANSYASGNVKGRYEGDPADQNGNLYIGGLVGVGKGSIENSYSSGKVTGDENDPLYTGCMVGAANATMTLTNSYYDATACNKLDVTGDEDGYVTISGTPAQNTAAMKIQSTFVDWNFTDTWKIMDDTYPFLKFFANSLNNAVVTTVSLNGNVYDGSAKTPLVSSVTLFGEALSYGTDYTIGYSNNVNAGMASIDVCGMGSYGGCKKIEFEIAAATISPTIMDIADVVYDGTEQKPVISVYNGDVLLAKNQYDVSYSNNISAGTALVTVTVKGNYVGSSEKSFEIKKAVPVISKKPVAENIVEESALSVSALTGGSANIEGSFEWVSPQSIVKASDKNFKAKFVPTDSDNYTESEEFDVSVKVLAGFDIVFIDIDGTVLQSEKVIEGYMPEYKGNDPERTENSKYSYSFIGWDSEITTVTEAKTYTAVYDSTLRSYTVTFKDGERVLYEAIVDYGAMPEYAGETPSRESTAKYDYSFVGWDSEITTVTGTKTYTAVYDSTLRSYTVTFKDGERVLHEAIVDYGTVPEYAGETPSRESTAKYDYSFVGWNSDISAVTGATSYIAMFDSTVRSYNVVFMKGSKELQNENLVYGSMPVYTGESLEQASTEKYDYAFVGWTPEIKEVTGDAVYKAQIDSTLREYTITFKNGVSILQSVSVAYGNKPAYSGETPTKISTAKYAYSFVGWDSEITTVTGTKTYTAVYDSTLRSYTVTFKDGERVLHEAIVDYGAVPEYAGETPSRESTAKYDYSFVGWNSDISAVTGATSYIAMFDSTVRSYNVVFMKGSKELQNENLVYGSMPVYTGESLEQASTEKYDYTFVGWTPEIKEVTGDAVYKAQIDSTLREYTITFMNGSEVLQSSKVAYGEMPKYLGPEPNRKATNDFAFKFAKWSPIIETVTENFVYVAIFDSTEVENSSSSVEPESSSSENLNGSSSSENNTVVLKARNLQYRLSVAGRNIQIAGASIGTSYALLDMQGRVMYSGIVTISNFNVSVYRAGSYLMRIGHQIQRVNVK